MRVILHKPGCWVHIDPRLSHTDIDVYPDTAPLPISDDDIAVRVVRLVNTKSYRGYFRFNTCVEQVKALLGIKNPLILTPKQLYRSLNDGITIRKETETF